MIVLAFTLVPLSAVSAPKITAGSSCKVLYQKVVYQSKTYTCIRSGKKLVWNKGIANKPIVTSKPTPSPTGAPFVGWSNTFDINSLVKGAIASTDAYQIDVRPDSSYDAIIQDSVMEPDRKWIGQMIAYTNGFFRRLSVKN